MYFGQFSHRIDIFRNNLKLSIATFNTVQFALFLLNLWGTQDIEVKSRNEIEWKRERYVT